MGIEHRIKGDWWMGEIVAEYQEIVKRRGWEVDYSPDSNAPMFGPRGLIIDGRPWSWAEIVATLRTARALVEVGVSADSTLDQLMGHTRLATFFSDVLTPKETT